MESQENVTDHPSRLTVTAWCPICNRRIEAALQPSSRRPRFFPFCSARCKLIDLGAWLDADYRIPDPREESPEDAIE